MGAAREAFVALTAACVACGSFSSTSNGDTRDNDSGGPDGGAAEAGGLDADGAAVKARPLADEYRAAVVASETGADSLVCSATTTLGPPGIFGDASQSIDRLGTAKC